MSKFDEYFLMQSIDAINFAREKLDFFSKDADLQCDEIGDGNINYIFRVRDRKSSRSVVIKQAGPTARISDEFVLSTDRNRIEAEVLQLENKLAPGLVPLVHSYDETMSCFVMEDLSEYTIMRFALAQHQTFPHFADHITTFMVNTLLLTSDVVLDHLKKKNLMGRYINPDLCAITEDLVFTEPFGDYKGRNDVFPPNLEWIKTNVYGDAELRLEVAKLKFSFLTNAQSLIHGDLHTGSIFVKPDSTKIIDPEFAFYGPMGYDIGNLIANLLFAWANGEATITDLIERNKFCKWVEKTIVLLVDLFTEKFLVTWKSHATEYFAKEPDFARWYLDGVMADAAGYVGLEIFRRIIGFAHVKDITSIADSAERLRIERICLCAAIKYVKYRTKFHVGSDFLNTFKEIAEKTPRN